jgi:hypothetical protein
MLLTLVLSGFKVHRPPGKVDVFMTDLWQGRVVWWKMEGGGERQTSTPDFVKRLLPDTDTVCLLSSLLSGIPVRRIPDLTVSRALQVIIGCHMTVDFAGL